jgi:hypothetical protein
MRRRIFFYWPLFRLVTPGARPLQGTEQWLVQKVPFCDPKFIGIIAIFPATADWSNGYSL